MMYKAKKTIFSNIKKLFLIFYALMSILPFLWVLFSAFKDNTAIFAHPFSLPDTLSFDNFSRALGSANIAKYFFNSLAISISTVVLLTIIISMATYVLTRVINAPAIVNYLMMGFMIPIHALLIPNFLIVRNLGLMNNKIGLILIYIAANTSFSYFLMSGYMQGIPKALDEAATIDGAGYFRTYFSIILPVSKAAIATVGTFAFINTWNDLLFALVINTKLETMTITQGINNLRGYYSTDYGLLCAGLFFAVVPVVIMYVFLQEHVVKGMTAGAVKG
ncbi:MAG: carbohydrate ABC transporter permease [Anaerolineaceae bacterium]|nr:MAG: carbohydrate ABC transporter permease [Anaerolineaceae bacterium]